MVSIATFRKIALSFPETAEQPHFEKTSFRVKKKIFATLAEDTGIATLKFSEMDQSLFCMIDKSAIYPVPNKWGKQGWTFIDLNKVSEELAHDALDTAYREVLNKSNSKRGK